MLQDKDLIVFSRIWCETMERFGLTVNHHGLAVAMHKASASTSSATRRRASLSSPADWGPYLQRAKVETWRYWDLQDQGLAAQKDLLERREVVFLPAGSGWLIRYRHHEWEGWRLKDWLRAHPVKTAFFFEARRPLSALRQAQGQRSVGEPAEPAVAG